MNNIMKRSFALALVLVMCITLLPLTGLSASATDVSYVYDGKYIYNWGTRGEVATFLSPNAEEFYLDNGSYAILASYAGGTSVSDAPTSDLYEALQDLMVSTHTHITGYNETRDLYKYTDCEDGGGAISSFYSGAPIGPSWDGGSTWNREHTWPNSKGFEGNDENDLMMLRPTASSENSSRGNKAYGKSAGYYNPNSESGGEYDVRGDVARIFLYVYVRWGNVNGNGEYTTWGASGVMESVEVLLEWMEADPVDTWELGRNDSVEAITGTRNVFVDYPEFAFMLFGEDIPATMSTPSGEGAKTCDHNNFDSGVVVAPTCTSKGYTLYTCRTADCGYSYRSNIVDALGHNYVNGACSVCGEAEPIEPEKPVYATEIQAGKAYKLGFYSTGRAAEYFFAGTMDGYYGATSTDFEKGVDVYAESTNGGYYLYFKNSSNQKQYINLVISGTYYNFTYSATASSVYTWDADKDTFATTLSGEVCYMGTYGSYFTVGVLRSSKYQSTDYVARFYYMESDEGGSSDSTCQHNYSSVVTAPTCMKGGYTTHTCSLCGDVYTDNNTEKKGHTYENGACVDCGKIEPTEATVSISFRDVANRTEFTALTQVWEQNGITVTNNKANSQSEVADYKNPGRFYKGSSLTIAYPGMVKLEINCAGLDSKYVNAWSSVPAGATATTSGGIVTIVFSSPVDSLVYSNLSAQCRAYDITVYAKQDTPDPCEHPNTTVEDAVEATCTDPGHTGKTRCDDCGEIIDEGEPTPLADHTDSNNDGSCDLCGAAIPSDGEGGDGSNEGGESGSGNGDSDINGGGSVGDNDGNEGGSTDSDNNNGESGSGNGDNNSDNGNNDSDNGNNSSDNGDNSSDEEKSSGKTVIIICASVAAVAILGGAGFIFFKKKKLI